MLCCTNPHLACAEQLHGFTGWPIEVGPEFVHGAHSRLTQVLDKYGLKSTEKPWPDYWYFGKQKLLTDNEGVAQEVNDVSGWLLNRISKPRAGAQLSA